MTKKSRLFFWWGYSDGSKIGHGFPNSMSNRNFKNKYFSNVGLYPLPLARNVKSSHKTKIKNKFQVGLTSLH